MRRTSFWIIGVGAIGAGATIAAAVLVYLLFTRPVALAEAIAGRF